MLTLYARYSKYELRVLQALCLDFAAINMIRIVFILTDASIVKDATSAKTLPV